MTKPKWKPNAKEQSRQVIGNTTQAWGVEQNKPKFQTTSGLGRGQGSKDGKWQDADGKCEGTKPSNY